MTLARRLIFDDAPDERPPRCVYEQSRALVRCRGLVRELRNCGTSKRAACPETSGIAWACFRQRWQPAPMLLTSTLRRLELLTDFPEHPLELWWQIFRTERFEFLNRRLTLPRPRQYLYTPQP